MEEVQTTQAQQRSKTDELLQGAFRNLQSGLRLLTFRKLHIHDFTANGDQVLLFALLSITVAIGAGFLLTDKNPQFSDWGFLYQGTNYVLMVTGAYLVSRWYGAIKSLTSFLVVLMSIEPVFEIINAIYGNFLDQISHESMWLVYAGLTLWIISIWWRAVRITFSGSRLKATGAVAIFCAATVAPQWWMPQASYWYTAYDDDEALKTVNVENVYYDQPSLLQSALSELVQERAGVVDLYHIGFGSYASQEVFRREIEHVRSILDGRFDTQGRSLTLINNKQTVSVTPIASKTNLKLALAGMAARMNPDEDILFLYLTGHGTKNAELSVKFWPLQLNQLSAENLKKMLDEAGINWRVVVISACYSGSFINVLKNERTIVITAAAQDKTSFGCSNENEYTYFGEAYFKHGLSKTHSFIEAFELANQSVSQRERTENLPLSQPTLFVGNEIREHLHHLDRRLSSAAMAPGTHGSRDDKRWIAKKNGISDY